MTLATKTRERLFVATSGLYPETVNGSKCWICVVDDMTRKSWLKFKMYPGPNDTRLLHSVIQTGFNMMEMSPKGSVQRRFLRALLVKSIPQTSVLKDLAALCNHPQIDSGTRYVQA